MLLLIMRFGKSWQQSSTENHGFARDCETSLKKAMFYKLKIVHPFSIVKKGLESNIYAYPNVKLAAHKQC